MRPSLLACALCLHPALPALADDAAPRLVAALSGDWNNDENPDAVLLYQHEHGMADLVVMQGDAVSGLQEVLRLPQVIWSGVMAGQIPGLEPRSATSFAIRSEQTGIGRTPWYQWITVAWREGDYRVAGYDYEFYDRIDLSHHGSCSVNLLTGAFTLHYGPGDEAPEIARQGQGPDRAFPLSGLTETWQAASCAEMF